MEGRATPGSALCRQTELSVHTVSGFPPRTGLEVQGVQIHPPPKYTPGNKIEIGATSTHGCDQTPPLKSNAVQILGLIFKRDEQQPLMIDRTVLDVETPGQTEEETQPCLCQLYEMSVNKYILLVCCALILFRELSTYTYHKCVGTLPQQP